MANDLDALWTDSNTVPAQPQEPAPPPAPPPPSPEIEDLRRDLYQTKGLLAGVLQQRQPPQAEPQPAPQGWQEREFLTEGEERLLLDSTKPRETLNKMFNTVAKTVHENLQGELRKRDEQLAQLQQGTQQYFTAAQQQQAQQHYQTQFYSKFNDLQGDEVVVKEAAQVVAQEYARAPWQFGSEDAILGRIGQVARDKKKELLTRWGGSGNGPQPEGQSNTLPAPPAAGSPARRAAMETGGSTRVGLPSPPKDSQAKAISAMIDHVRNGRR